MNHPKNQHYVPQFILKNFCFDKDHLFCFDKRNGNIFSPNVRNVASENFFNDMEDGIPESSLEYSLTELENKAAPGLKKLIIDRTVRNLTKLDIQNISLFIAVQLLRTKNVREDIRHTNHMIANILRESGAEPNKVINFHMFESEQDVKQTALNNLSIAADLCSYLTNKKWFLYTSDEKFIISDNPVTRQNTFNESKVRSTLGLANIGIEIYLPLSPSVVLCLLCQDIFNNLTETYELYSEKFESKGSFELRNFVNSVKRKIPIQCKPENIENLNYLQVRFSERFLFSKCDNFELAQELVAQNARFRFGIRSDIK